MSLSGLGNYAASFIVEIKDKYSARVKKMEKATASFRTRLNQAGKDTDKLANKLSKMGSKLANLRTGFAAAMFTMGLKAVTNDAFEFSDVMNTVKKNTGATVEEMKRLRNQAMKLNAETKFTALDVGGTQAFLGQTSLSVKQILSVMPKVLEMATAGDISPLASAELLSQTVNMYGEDISKIKDFADIISFVSVRTETNMTKLAASVLNAGGSAAAMNIPFKDMVSVLGILAKKGEMGANTGTKLSMAFTKLIEAAGRTPGKKAVATLNRLKIARDEIFEENSTQFRDGGILRFFELIDQKGGVANDISDIFTVKSGRMLFKMLGMSDALVKLRAEMDETNISSKKLSDIKMEGLAGATLEARSAWRNMRLAIGESVSFITIPILKLKKATADYIKSSPILSATIGIFMGIAAALLYVVTISGVVFSSLSGILIMFGKIAVGPFMKLIASGGMVTAIKLVAAATWSVVSPMLVVLGALVAIAVAIRFVNKLRKQQDANEKRRKKWHEAGYRRVGMTWMPESTLKVGQSMKYPDMDYTKSGMQSVLGPAIGQSLLSPAMLDKLNKKDTEPTKVELDGQININAPAGTVTIPYGGGNIPMNVVPQ